MERYQRLYKIVMHLGPIEIVCSENVIWLAFCFDTVVLIVDMYTTNRRYRQLSTQSKYTGFISKL